MTIINGIEIDNITYNYNEIKMALLNNDPISEFLNVIIVISNPCQYAKRYILAKDFIKRFEEEEKNVKLYIVELIYDLPSYKKQTFQITDKNNPQHLQIKTNKHALWHKENMINMGVKHLLPKDWKNVAWIDADIEFENPYWATDTLKLLNGCRDIVQLFSHAIDMDSKNDAMNIFSSFGYQYSKNRKYSQTNVNKLWHPGFAWACTRKAYEKMGGLYDLSILGSGDHNMSLSLIGKADISLNSNVHVEYKNSVLEYQNRVKNLRLGYVPGVIRHYYHGSKQNRKYNERWQIIVENQYNPKEHINYRKDGLIIPSMECPQKLLSDIYQYFEERNEDEE